jgi:hypothetical protein
METILRFLSKKFFFPLIIVLFFFAYLILHHDELLSTNSPNSLATIANTSATLDSAILSDLEHRESVKLQTLHKIVSREISIAQAKGFDVKRLQKIADQALSLDTRNYRATAIDRLNSLRLAIPQSKEVIRPAGFDDEPSDEIKTSQDKPVRRSSRKR